MKPKNNCIGQNFGRLTVLDEIPGEWGKSRTKWIVRCDCGAEFECLRERFDGRSKIPSCGCYKKEFGHINAASKRKPDCTGQRFGMLTVLSKSTIKIRGSFAWKMRCDCGNTLTLVRGDFDKTNGQKSCGCATTVLKRKNSGLKTENLEGQRFGELTVIRSVRGWNTKETRIRASNECRCECGAIVWRTSHQLKVSKFLNCRSPEHLIGPKYPPMPSPMPNRVAELILKFYPFISGEKWENVRPDIQDEKVKRLERSAWIICYKELQGENLSDRYCQNFIHKWMRYSLASINLKAYNLRSGGYNNLRRSKLTGGEMTNPSFNNAVTSQDQTQQNNLLPRKPKTFRKS